MELSELLKKYKGLLQQNIIEFDKQDIDTFNKIAEEKEIVPKAYQLLILVSKFDNLKKDKEPFSRPHGIYTPLIESHVHHFSSGINTLPSLVT